MPVIVSGGLRTAERARARTSESGADAVMIARGSLGNPWIFEELRRRGATRAAGARRDRRRAALGARPRRGALGRRARAARNLRKFYPWYLERLGITGTDADAFQRTESLDEVRERLLALARDRGRPHRYNRAPARARVRRKASRFGRFLSQEGLAQAGAVSTRGQRTDGSGS